MSPNKTHQLQKDLEEPLLPPSKPLVAAADEQQQQPQLPCSLWRLKVLSFVTGSVAAALSQAILSKTLWGMESSMLSSAVEAAAAAGEGETGSTVSTPTTLSVVGFSLVWSFWTCVMIFLAMVASVRLVLGSPPSTSGTGGKQNVHKAWEDVVFQMEAHHIVGALLSISAIWVAVDVLQSIFAHEQQQQQNGSSPYAHQEAANAMMLPMPSPIQNALLFTMGLAWYALFARCILKKDSGDSIRKAEDDDASKENGGVASSLLSTYTLIAATLGLISGLCSQFLLSFVLWKDNMTQPIVDHVILFSILWSFCTVILTFLGCLSLRLLTVEEENRLTAERIFLRMESHYIFCSLIGICSAWILIDLVMDMREQIFPSVLMLALSLAAFTGIVHCFPEEACLAELQAEADATVAQVEREKLIEKAVAAIQVV